MTDLITKQNKEVELDLTTMFNKLVTKLRLKQYIGIASKTVTSFRCFINAKLDSKPNWAS